MSKKTQNFIRVSELFISLENINRILMWSQSNKEINYICFGKGKFIENVYRLSNTSRIPENYSCWNESESKALIKEKKKSGQIVLAWGHSHPKKYHEQHPSLVDIKYIKKGAVELIAFPNKNLIKAWVIGSSLKETLNSEVQLVPC